ncbi:MAG: hypothetical protein KIS68_13220 [Bauldia sp.]|nr:hypothetical protein [Bauldia sp.]
MSFRTAAIAALATIAIGAATTGASAQQGVETYSNFRWANISPATCLMDARTAVNAAISGFGLGGMITDEDTWYVEAGTEDLNLWVYCVADDDTPDVDYPGAKRVLVVINVNTSRPNVGSNIRDFLAECMEFGCPAMAPVTQAAERIDWVQTATRLRGNIGVRYSYICPALGDTIPGTVWGTDVYTDDSSICAAAVHTGAIGTGGGLVTIEIAAGQAAYEGTVRNGISTNRWSSYQGSFRVIRP